MAPSPQTNVIDGLFAGGGEMGALMRSLDWSKTPLGAVEMWPQSLKTSVGICLNSRFPILVWWGPKLVKLYNDAYIQLIGSKHPGALGCEGRQVWPEIWDTIGPMLTGVLDRGEATLADDMLLLLERNGYAEECYFTFCYSPIRNDQGGVGGVFTPVTETTEKVIARRRLDILRKVAAVGGSKPKDARDACALTMRAISADPYDVPFAAIYLFDHAGKRAVAVANFTADAPSATGEWKILGTVDSRDEDWLPYGRVAAGETCVIDLNSNVPFPLPRNPWGVPSVQAITLPLNQPGATAPVGFLLAGVNPRKRLDDEYRRFYAQLADEIGGAIREAETLQRERALRTEAEMERAQIRDLFMNAPAAIARFNGPEHRFTLVNQRYVQLVGRESMAQLIDKPLMEAMPELAGQGIVELLDQVYRTGVPFVGNDRRIEVDRTAARQPVEGFFSFIYQPVFDAQGKVDGILVLAVDVTEQVLAHQEIESREKQFRVLADSIPQMAWMANPDGTIFWYNRRWYEYTGATLEEMEGWGWQSIHDPKLLPEVMAEYEHCLRTGEPFDMAFPLRGADGKFRSFLTRALPVRDAAGAIIRWFGTNTDVEGQQKTEAALRQSEKLAAVGRLASSIAHEINNPLEAVTNLIYLARSAAVNEDAKVYLESAQQELDRVSQITNQTLRFHKQQSAPSATDIVDLIDSILALYRGKLARDGVQLQMDVQECPPLLCYAGEVRQVLANLVGNALEAMPRGGTLRFRVRPATDWRRKTPGIRVTVADTGHGMPAETRKRIYEPFFTTKGETGTGLGLWVSAGIVDKHAGSMHVRSSAQSGASWTVFTVILPLDGAGNPPVAGQPSE